MNNGVDRNCASCKYARFTAMEVHGEKLYYSYCVRVKLHPYIVDADALRNCRDWKLSPLMKRILKVQGEK